MLSLLAVLVLSAVKPIACAHAHNDYAHDRPLTEALENGFCSVEADIFLVDGALLVGHNQADLKPERTLESLYLDPLAKTVREHGGSVYGDGTVVTLLVDVKGDAETTATQLRQVLPKYKDMLVTLRKRTGVQIIISGNRPKVDPGLAGSEFLFIDGRLSDLVADPRPQMPFISDNFESNFTWRGQGNMSADERMKLETIVKRTHAHKQKIRFWAIPDNEAGWSAMLDAGVDYVNTDHLAEFRKFYETRTGTFNLLWKRFESRSSVLRDMREPSLSVCLSSTPAPKLVP
ncbi:phosphatidylinositol-specific phospholipase C/glycerophosphodiester phosphodiesterase family protein [soil metagenome]